MALGVPLAAAFVLFGLLFRGVVFDFWWQMALSVAGLCASGWILHPRMFGGMFRPQERSPFAPITLGLLSAGFLYGTFYAGNLILRRFSDAAGHQITSVYGFRHGASPWLIAVLLLAVIGPGEEIFWRGYLQRGLTRRYSAGGLAAAMGAYTLVHAAAGNPVLLLAALVCGAFWGYLYWRFNSIWLNIVSHAAWDLAVFALWPLM